MTRTAGAAFTARCSARARPFFRITTTGLPVAATASASACCGAGTMMSVRDCPSPDIPALSPIASSTTSAARAAATAASIPPGRPSSTPEPAVTVMEAGVGDRGAHAGRQVHRLRVVAVHHPGPGEVVQALRERTDDGDALARAG